MTLFGSPEACLHRLFGPRPQCWIFCLVIAPGSIIPTVRGKWSYPLPYQELRLRIYIRVRHRSSEKPGLNIISHDGFYERDPVRFLNPHCFLDRLEIFGWLLMTVVGSHSRSLLVLTFSHVSSSFFDPKQESRGDKDRLGVRAEVAWRGNLSHGTDRRTATQPGPGSRQGKRSGSAAASTRAGLSPRRIREYMRRNPCLHVWPRKYQLPEEGLHRVDGSLQSWFFFFSNPPRPSGLPPERSFSSRPGDGMDVPRLASPTTFNTSRVRRWSHPSSIDDGPREAWP